MDKIEILPRYADNNMDYPGKDDVIFKSGNIVINRDDIDDILTNQYLPDNHVDAFAFLLSEKKRIMTNEFQPYLYISPLYRVYKGYKQDYEMFIQHINPDSVREANLLFNLLFSKAIGY
ncbi:hypothetical protein IEQ34_019814 [Dendrobium chrysotoxum]|uniref:Uncharacterized protein n=1 Tax=Dendrobium chrysotoxum TaxID=161865 RepID=A0AAV7G8P5_DENCH|nr:hypothetical protein IEQ34_019814 [Dendrobium chrysotoxum]